jgi:hypothetical protein
MAFMGAALHGLKGLAGAGKKAGKAAPGTGGAQAGSQAGSASTGQKLKQGYKNWTKQGNEQRRPKQELDLSPKFAARGVPSMKHGGRVKTTGLHILHKGEHVIPAAKRSARSGSRKRVLVKL